MAPDLFQVFYLGSDGDVLGPNAGSRPAPSPLGVADEAERIGEAIKLGKEVAVVEIRPTVEDEDGGDLPEVAVVERRSAGRHISVARNLALSGEIGVNIAASEWSNDSVELSWLAGARRGPGRLAGRSPYSAHASLNKAATVIQ